MVASFLARSLYLAAGDGEKPRHVSFWHRELNNVPLRVLKLSARTGKMNGNFKSCP